MDHSNRQTVLRIAAVAGVAATSIYSIYSLYQAISTPPSPNFPKIIPSPRTTVLPKLSDGEVQDLPYPPDVFPGARDVETPYGSIRVYEWGPNDGRKVLLIHGISTPSISMAGIADRLAKQGCRVMLFDLFGRGYSSCPATLPHDIRLYTSQIFLVLASSPLSWTGSLTASTKPPRFTLVGYSLGGCIATHFTATFPHLISNLVLVAPAGLIRVTHVGWQNRLLYSSFGGLIPESWVERTVANRLKGGPTGATAVTPKKFTGTGSSFTGNPMGSGPAAPIAAEVANTTRSSTINPSSASHTAPPAGSSFDNAILFPDRPTVSVAAAVNWQVAHHRGFLPAFISTIRHCPIHRQQDIWRVIGSRLSPARARGEAWPREQNDKDSKPGLDSRILVVVGKADPVIIPEELKEDASEAIGEQNVEFVEVEAGHELPITRNAEIVQAMEKMWERGLREI